jgi:hypothetical protein
VIAEIDTSATAPRSREEQGLPAVVTDSDTIERLAAIFDRAPEPGP